MLETVATAIREIRPDLDIGYGLGERGDDALVVGLDLGGNYLEIAEEPDHLRQYPNAHPFHLHVRVDTFYVEDSDPDSEDFHSTYCLLDLEDPEFSAQLNAKLAEVFGPAQ
jgi:hypothetical protein